MDSYKQEVIRFLLKNSVLKFGEYTLKSGRVSPYFINTGSFDSGAKITELGNYYAGQLQRSDFGKIDVIFGPAYKGIPLAVAAASALKMGYNHDVGFAFNRKEAKTRGEGGLFVGAPIVKGTRVVLVEDVVTAGTTLHEVVPLLRDQTGAEVVGVVVLADRCERGIAGELSAVQESEKALDIRIRPIISVYDILDFITATGEVDIVFKSKIEQYLAQYGCVR